MRRTIVTLAICGSGCLFNGAETEGLPCINDNDCANGYACIERICGGPMLVGTSEGASESSDSGGEDTAEPVEDENDDAREECVPSDTECLDDDVVRLCLDDGKLQTLGCPGACGEAARSLGCHAGAEDEGCWCDFERAPCSSEGALDCLSNGQLGICEGGWWERNDCDDVCVQAGYGGSTSCGPGDGNDVCFCDSACTEGAQRCVNDNDLAGCWGGSWQIDTCGQICADNGYTGTLGCLEYPDQDSGCACI
jgi:hypothetical protein